MTDMEALANSLMTWSIYAAFVIVAVSQILAMIRLYVGPSVGDRILALDTMFINAIALLVLIGIFQGTQIYFEAVLIIAMLGFVSTVAYARFVLRGDIIE
ncbi:Na(+)/H(+) antiporter subunit F [Flavimaricola marinus]|uniref:Na(+)/H(+) antiporter subunit F n=2 Tax=Flavimaricola marinus TaxID=1819565 RepID=A0A238LBZ7_9RHOB|nr:Na(+)/H(+) antiporter subunit F [Flavimaricola marinus]